MVLIDWSALHRGVPELKEVRYKGRARLAIVTKKYKKLPWFVNTPVMAPPIDILSNGKNLAAFFKRPKPVGSTEEVVIFERIKNALRKTGAN